MTEEEWLSGDELLLLMAVPLVVSDRKRRLFACGCCRQIEKLMKSEISRRALEVSELYADGKATDAGRKAANRKSSAVAYDLVLEAAATATMAAYAAKDAAVAADLVSRKRVEVKLIANCCLRAFAATPAKSLKADVLWRDVIGNPFKSPKCLRSDRGTSTVLSIASTIYEDHAFGRMPILADALEEAGCDDADILAHSRGDGPHVRGCWVVDLVLGKS